MKKQLLSLMMAIVILFSACAGQPSAPTWQEQYDLGVRYLSEGNYQEAIIAFTAAIEIDPMQADTYDKLADAFLALGDMDAALDALQKGSAATGDTGFAERIRHLELVGLTVLVRQDFYWTDGSPSAFSIYSYDANGYMMQVTHHFGEHQSVNHWQYDTGSGLWCFYMNGEFSREQENRSRGGSDYVVRIYNLTGHPYPNDAQPDRVENESPKSGEEIGNRAEDWAYAEYVYNDNGNAIEIYSYGSGGNLLGYCVLEWAVFQPDGNLASFGSGAERPEPPDLDYYEVELEFNGPDSTSAQEHFVGLWLTWFDDMPDAFGLMGQRTILIRADGGPTLMKEQQEYLAAEADEIISAERAEAQGMIRDLQFTGKTLTFSTNADVYHVHFTSSDSWVGGKPGGRGDNRQTVTLSGGSWDA